jgi:hypothetical protein
VGGVDDGFVLDVAVEDVAALADALDVRCAPDAAPGVAGFLVVACGVACVDWSVGAESDDDDVDVAPVESANADPHPNPVTTAAPTPSATASPPIRPTCVDGLACPARHVRGPLG